MQDEAQQLQHFQSWESYWGKPGKSHHTLRHNKDGKITSVPALADISLTLIIKVIPFPSSYSRVMSYNKEGTIQCPVFLVKVC